VFGSAIFTDISLDPRSRIGVAGCLLLPIAFLDTPTHDIDRGELSGKLLCRQFTDTSSTKLELQGALWGVELYRTLVPDHERCGLRLYTDSQCVSGLPARRERLEGSGYQAARSGRRLANAGLYAELFAAKDELGFEIVKVAGHSRTSSHDSVQRIFSIVDRGARQSLKLMLSGLQTGKLLQESLPIAALSD
jgi:ribonuclease HI